MRTVCMLFVSLLYAPIRAQDFAELTDVLAAAATLDDEMVGDDGGKSATYRAYEKWLARGTVAELKAATNHASPIVRCYAVRALVHLEASVDWPALMAQHLMDAAEVTTFQGCCQAKELVGDVIFTTLREHLGDEQVQDVAEALLRQKSPLYAREWALRNLRLRDGMLHFVRDLASHGDGPAAIALARYGLAVDVPILIEHLQKAEPFDGNAHFLAVELHQDARLLAPLIALEGKARQRLTEDNPYRLRFWLQAIAAQHSQDAGQFLLRFLQTTKPASDFKQKNLLETYAELLAPHAECAPFDGVRAELRARQQALGK